MSRVTDTFARHLARNLRLEIVLNDVESTIAQRAQLESPVPLPDDTVGAFARQYFENAGYQVHKIDDLHFYFAREDDPLAIVSINNLTVRGSKVITVTVIPLPK